MRFGEELHLKVVVRFLVLPWSVDVFGNFNSCQVLWKSVFLTYWARTICAWRERNGPCQAHQEGSPRYRSPKIPRTPYISLRFWNLDSVLDYLHRQYVSATYGCSIILLWNALPAIMPNSNGTAVKINKNILRTYVTSECEGLQPFSYCGTVNYSAEQQRYKWLNATHKVIRTKAKVIF
jgi:hypothetical protein